MRTSYCQESKDSSDQVRLEEQDLGMDEDDILKEEEECDMAEDDEEQDLGMSDEDKFDNIFSNGVYEVITPDFYKISQEVESALSLENDGVLNPEDEVTCDTIEDIGEKDENVSSSKGENSSVIKKPPLSKKLIAGSVTLLVALGVSFGCGLLGNGDEVKDLEKQIDKLYTSNRKEDLKNNVTDDKLYKYYEKLDGIKDSEDKKGIKEELDTISYYLSDKGILEQINDSSYDLNSNSSKDDLDKIKRSSSDYSVSSLSSTISSKVNQIEGDYSYFVNLRDELSSVQDTANFDIGGYQVKVNKVTHTSNKQELQVLLDHVSRGMKISETVEDIKNSTSVKVDEATSDIKNDLSTKMGEFSDSAQTFLSDILEEFKDIFSKDIVEK